MGTQKTMFRFLDRGGKKFYRFSNFSRARKKGRTSKEKTLFLSHISGRFFAMRWEKNFPLSFLFAFVYDETFSFKRRRFGLGIEIEIHFDYRRSLKVFPPLYDPFHPPRTEENYCLKKCHYHAG